MSQNIYIHNITKGFYNEELSDAVELSEVGDVIKFSIAGSALVIDLITLEEDRLNEFEYVKEMFLNRFTQFHEEIFI